MNITTDKRIIEQYPEEEKRLVGNIMEHLRLDLKMKIRNGDILTEHEIKLIELMKAWGQEVHKRIKTQGG